MPNRFVILHHRTTEGEHWDLMLEKEDVLLTWQLMQDPLVLGNWPVPARRIGDHRKLYLDYEGLLTGDRGEVRRVEEGTVEFREINADKLVIDLRGQRLAGCFRLVAQGDQWSFERIS